MNRVILVDDEQFVRRGLLALVEWNKIGYEVIGEASDGEDALELILAKEPDLVLTDIRMPVFDGLELIKKAKEQCRKVPKFIVVSGYNDFKYAQQAVRYGVCDFLLKPVDKVEIENVLKDLVPVIEKEQHTERMKLRTSNLESFQKIVANSVSNVDTEALSVFIEEVNQDICYVIIDIRDSPLIEMIDEKLHHVIANFITDPHVYIHPFEREGFGVIFQAKHLPKNRNEFSWFLSRLKEYIEQNIEKRIFLFSGTIDNGIEGLRRSYAAASKAFHRRYMYDGSAPFIFNEQLEQLHQENRSLSDIYITQMIEKMEENNQIEIDKLLNLWSAEVQEKAATLDAMRTFLFQLEQQLHGTILKFGGSEEHIYQLPSLLDTFKQKLILQELNEKLRNYTMKGSAILSDLNKEKFYGDIYKIKRYIEQHFDQNLTLKKIANEFYMNPVYLGQLFKKSYGVYFKEYLLEVRVKKAKKILRQSDIRIYEVAEQVGFGSPDYFVTQFEKMEGVTPSKYRQQIMNK